MNPELPRNPPEELEARLTALLLGELSATEATAVRQAIEQDGELAKLFARLHHTIPLVREAAASSDEPASAPTHPLKLSEERRQKLLAQFKTVAPKEFTPEKRRGRISLVEIAAVVTIIGLLAAISIPSFKNFTTRGYNASSQIDILSSAPEAEEIRALKPVAPTAGANEVYYFDSRAGNHAVATTPLPAPLPPAQIVLPAIEPSPTARPVRNSEVTFGDNASLGINPGLRGFYDSAVAPSTGLPVATPDVGLAQNGVQDSEKDFRYYNDLNRSRSVTPVPPSGVVALAEAAPQAADAGAVDNLSLGGELSDVAGAAYRRRYGATPSEFTIPRVAVSGGAAGGGGGGDKADSSSAITTTFSAEAFDGAVTTLYDTNGANADGGKSVLNLDRAGKLPVPTTPPERGAIAAVIPLAVPPPPQAKGTATFAEMSPTDSKALGFAVTPGIVPNGSSVITVNDGLAESWAVQPPQTLTLGEAATINGRTTEMPVAGVPVLGDPPVLGQLSTNSAADNFVIGSSAMQGRRIVPEPNVHSVDLADVAFDESAQRQPTSVVLQGLTRVQSRQAQVTPEENKPASDSLLTAGLRTKEALLAKTESKDQQLPETSTELKENRAYFAKKRELEELTESRRLLTRRMNLTDFDASLPKSSQVIIVETAKPKSEPNQTLWGTLRSTVSGDVERAARIKLERDKSDIEELSGKSGFNAYDPYFVQTEFEVIQSEAVLGKVVNQLGLDKTWAKNQGVNGRLNVSDAVSLLRKRLNLRSVPNTKLVEIRAKADQPEEAAGIANAVAEAYQQWRLEQGRQLSTGEMKALAQRSAEQDEKIRRIKEELTSLRTNLAISDIDAVSTGPQMLMEAEQYRKYEQIRLEREVIYKSRKEEYESALALGTNNTKALRELLPRVQPDPTLSELINELNVADQRAKSLTNDIGPKNPELTRINGQQALLNEKIDRAVAGILKAMETRVVVAKAGLDSLVESVENARQLDAKKLTVRKPATNAPIPQPEVQTSENNFSTFSLNVSDVSFKLAAASLEKGQMPDATTVRSEEFINAFDYRDPEPAAGAPIAFAWERAHYPFAHNRDLLRFSLKTAAAGRQAGRPLNVVLLLDNSGSMERADRVQIIREALRVLASQLQPQDKLSVITFARTARLVADGISGDKAGEVAEQVSGLTPQGGTNLEDAMNLAYQTAARHYLANGINRVVLLTDGAANLGDVEPESLKQKVETQRKQGIALDCFGIGWDGFNDDLLEVLSRNGDGRYGFINSPEEAATEFAGQLAGALKVAASDVKVQVEFNPKRVTAYRQIGYAKHQLTKEQFRDNTVDAAEIAAQEAGNALYTVEVNPAGEGPIATVRVRYKVPGTTDYREQAWDVPFTGNVLSLEQSSPAMRLAASASAFSEWLVASPFAGEVSPDALLGYLRGVPEIYGADSRPKKLEWMIHQARSIEGK